MKSTLITLILALLILPFQSIESRNNDNNFNLKDAAADASPVSEFALKSIKDLFERFPDNTFSWDAFQHALTGLTQITSTRDIDKPYYLTIIDFSKPSTEKRLYVVDLRRAKILYSSLVAHGRNSGENMATNFSNKAESYQSSLGFYLTAETYQGKHGLSLRLDGLEKGFNDKARERGIVIHGADYVSENFANAQGRLGRSQGCPALPEHMNQAIIQTIKEGSLLFIYAPQPTYLAKSTLLKTVDADCILDALAFTE